MSKLSDRINDTNAAPWVIEEIRKLESERDQAQRIASLALEVEDWLFRTLDALTDDPSALPERVQTEVMYVWTDMNNAREKRGEEGD